MSFIISTQNLTKSYRDTESGLETKALDGVSLSIERGDFAAISGPSGSGKTTLLNIIGGLERPTSGVVSVDGTDYSSLDDARLAEFRLKNIGFVFQSHNLIPSLTVLENVEFVAFLQGVSRKHRQHEAPAILKDLGLEAMMRHWPAELSPGLQQRVAVARAILAQPKLILMEEPTANLDSRTGEELIDLMYRMSRNAGITFVFATHDPMVMGKAKTLVKMRDGKFIE